MELCGCITGETGSDLGYPGRLPGGSNISVEIEKETGKLMM